MLMYKTLFLVAILLFPLFSSAYADEPVPTAALNRLEGSGLTEGEITSLTNALRGELSRTGRFNVMERSQIDEILSEQGFQHTGLCTDESCVIEMGQLLAVRYMFLGYIGKVGATFSVSVRQIDVGSGRVVRDVTQNYRGDVDNILVDVIPSVALQLAGIEIMPDKRRKIWPYVAGGVLAAGAVPAVILLRGDSEDVDVDGSTGVTIEW